MLDELRMSLEEDQYLIDQVEKIKHFMTKYLQDEPSHFKTKNSLDKLED